MSTFPIPVDPVIHIPTTYCLDVSVVKNIFFRFFSCPNKFSFLKSSVNVIDYIATISFYTDLFLQQYVSHIKNADIFEFFSIIRILRLFKLTRHSSGLKILLQTFRASAKGRFHLIIYILCYIYSFLSTFLNSS